MNYQITKIIVTICLVSFSLPASLSADSGLTIPDFTKGDVRPENAPHDWNLGPTGMRGWMFCDRLVTTDARQILITAVDDGSPADGIIRPGDVILGVSGQAFSYDPRTEFGRAITVAETNAGNGNLVLNRWRNGNAEDVTLKLPVLGTFSATAPYECRKSEQILAQGIARLAVQMAQAEYTTKTNPIPRCLNALALLAAGDDSHAELLKREAQWAADFQVSDFRTWYYGYVMIFLAEYITTTGDTEVLPALRRLAVEAASGQSAVGSWGHTFALPDGRLRGYGMMNSPGLPLTIGMVLAGDAGVDDAEVLRAIDLSTRLLRFYTGKGAIPYGDHTAWTETHEDNGKCGMAAILFNLLSERESTDFFTRMAVASHGNERDCGHTGNYFNVLWSLPAIAQGGPFATGAWMQEFGGWYHDLARRWDGSFAHQGPPQPTHDSYRGWDATGAYLLAYALPLKKISITGRKPSVAAELSVEVAEGLIADGRGWDNKDRKTTYDQMDDRELIERLGSWSPVVRERAAAALARRKNPPIDALIALLDSENLTDRIGACHALEELRGRADGAVAALRGQLQHDDLWLRIRAATALAAIGDRAVEALPDMLTMISRGPSPEDPRGMEQRYVASAIFGKMLNRLKTLDEVDQEKLRNAIADGLQNQDGRARSEISLIYRRLSYDEVRPILPAVFEAIQTPAPSGEMFADGVRLNGLKLLAAHHIEEGMQACADYLRSQNPWASEHRTPEVLEVLKSYGSDAQRVIPHLLATATMFDNGEPNFPANLSKQKAAAVRDAIESIQAAKLGVPLRRLN